MSRSRAQGRRLDGVYDTIDLARALSRLEAKILTSDPHSRLRYSPYERAKTAANVEYARTLLLRLEHSTSAVKTQSRKHAAQETLLRQRNLIKRLNDRLYELGQQDDGAWPSDESEDEDEDEDIAAALSDPAPPTPKTALPQSPASAAQPQAQTIQAIPETPGAASFSPTTSAPEPTSTLRTRRPAQASSTLKSASTTTAHALNPSQEKESLFSSTTNSTTSPPPITAQHQPTDQTSHTTHALETQTTLQTDLTTSLLDLASQLKSSAQQFSTSLDLDTETLGKTETALGKNKEGMDAASARMGTLRKMSEGRWWWGRMVLYAGIAGLWCVAIVLVFGGPKLRF